MKARKKTPSVSKNEPSILVPGVTGPFSLSGLAVPRFAHQRHAMLHGFSLAGENGYTDEQAAKAAGINLERRPCYWKRASELREFGYIEPVREAGVQLTRRSDANGMQGVWRITGTGRNQLPLWRSK